MEVRYFIILVMLLASQANAAEWRTEDIQREAVFGALLIIDWRQTIYISKHPDRFGEANPMIHLESTVDLNACRQGAGPNDTVCDHTPDPENTQRVNKYFLIAALAHVGVTHLLSNKWRSRWQYVTIGVQTGTVYHNYSAGVRLDF